MSQSEFTKQIGKMPKQPNRRPQADPPPQLKDVAVAGCGQAGTAQVTALVRKIAKNKVKNVRITVFSADGQYGPGGPYDISLPNHFRLAHEFDFMGAVNIMKPNAGLDDFYNWVQENKGKEIVEVKEGDRTKQITLSEAYKGINLNNPKNYPPRSLYGRYLKARFEETKSYATRHGIEVKPTEAFVENVKQGHGQVLVSYTLGQTGTQNKNVPFHQVVLASGHSPRPPNPVFKDTERYFNPYPVEKYSSRITTESVVVLFGTGQTATEVATSLGKLGVVSSQTALDLPANFGKIPPKQIYMVSRHAQLRAVRGPFDKEYKRQYLTIEELEKRGDEGLFNLADVLELLHEEMRAAYGSDEFKVEELVLEQDPIKLLSESIAAAKTVKELKWRTVLNSLGTDNDRQKIYERLRPEDKTEFMEKYYSLFFSFQAPMPLPVAEELLEMLKCGRIKILVGDYTTTTWDRASSKFRIIVSDRDPTRSAPPDGRDLEADIIINATGQSPELSHVPPWTNMLSEGSAIKSPYGGILLDPNSRELYVQTHGTSGRKRVITETLCGNVYAIGPVGHGEVLISYNAKANCDAAENTSDKIVERLKEMDTKPLAPKNMRAPERNIKKPRSRHGLDNQGEREGPASGGRS